MTHALSSVPELPHANGARADTEEQLSELLKRCSPETIHAAIEFAHTRDPDPLERVVRGVVARYVERGLRHKLDAPCDYLRLVEDLGVDSLTLMEIVLLTEEALGISISSDELTRLRTLGDVRRFVTSKVASRPGQ